MNCLQNICGEAMLLSLNQLLALDVVASSSLRTPFMV